MQLLFKRPLLDELLSSVWVRTAHSTGLSIGALATAIVGRKTEPGFFQASHVRQLATIFELLPEDLVRRHTVLPYAVSFYPEASRQSALANVLEVGQPAIGMGAVTQSVSDFVTYRRWCPKCCLQEWRQNGQTYWHRSHNLPGVLICIKHRVTLRQSEMLTSGRTSWEYVLPEDDVNARRVRLRSGYPMLALAQRSVALLAIGERVQAATAEDYRKRLIGRGLLSPSREINAEKLKALVHSVFRQDIAHLGLQESAQSLDWVSLMLRPGVKSGFAPLKHLVLQTALDLADSSQRVDHVPSGLSRRPLVAEDTRGAATLQGILDKSLAAGEKVGVQAALQEAGVWSQFRHDRERFPQVQAAVKKLRRSRAALRRARRRMNAAAVVA